MEGFGNALFGMYDLARVNPEIKRLKRAGDKGAKTAMDDAAVTANATDKQRRKRKRRAEKDGIMMALGGIV